MSLGRRIAKRLGRKEEQKKFTDFLRERPLDVTYRRLVKKVKKK